SPDFAPQFTANGDVLQVRVTAAQASAARAGLMINRVQTTRSLINQFWQSVYIRPLELDDFTMFQNFRGNLVLFFQIFQNAGGGGLAVNCAAFISHFQLQIFEQYLVKLLGAVDIKRPAETFLMINLVDFFLYRVKLRAQRFAELFQMARVNHN